MGLAVAGAAPSFRKPLPKLTPEHLGTVGAFAREFFREIRRRVRPPFLLVLDDLQTIAVDARLHELLVQGVAELPPGGHALFLSRPSRRRHTRECS